MSDKPKFTLGNGKHVFSLENAYFADKDGNRLDIPNAAFPVQSDSEPTEPIIYGGPIKAEWGFTVVSRKMFNDLLLIIDPREWARRNWWKLPALWERKR